jgi:hypothetical protein
MPLPYTITPDEVLNQIWKMCNNENVAYWFKLVESIKGGGGFENWALGKFFIYLWTTQGKYDWQREYPAGSKRVDLAFNVTEASMTDTTPLILTEWKANCNYDTMSAGLALDYNKLQAVIPALAAREIYPCPFIFGIGPNKGGGFEGCRHFSIPNSGLYFYYSTVDTWRGSWSYADTWYARRPQSNLTASPATVPF